MGSSVDELAAGQKSSSSSKWVDLNSPDPPAFLHQIFNSIKNSFIKLSSSSPSRLATSIFPLLSWVTNYKLSMFKNDFIAGLTLASLSIPQASTITYKYLTIYIYVRMNYHLILACLQSIGYAALANLDPQYGLCK